MALLLSMAMAAAAETDTAWEYLENPDPYADGLVAVAHRREGHGATAMVRCWSATRVFDVRLGFPDLGKRTLSEVQLHFDTVPSLSPVWSLSPNRRHVVIARQDHPMVLSGLRRANDVTISARYADGTEQSAVVYLHGSSAAIGRVLEACGPARPTRG
jgi:hypothetical protein